MKVMLEFFSGSGQMAQEFAANGYNTQTIDNNPDLKPDLVKDILSMTAKDLPEKYRRPIVAWFSPPCQKYSVCTIGKHWRNGKPKTSECYIALAQVMKCFELIEELQPKYWFIENPRGMLRKVDFMQKYHRKTVTYCQYGDKNQKPTDIFTNLVSWTPRKPCKAGDSCHEYQPRSYKSKIKHGVVGLGIQGLANAYERGKLPKQLCKEIVDACENKQKIRQEVLI